MGSSTRDRHLRSAKRPTKRSFEPANRETAGRFCADQQAILRLLKAKPGVRWAAAYDFGYVVKGRRRKCCSFIVEFQDGSVERRERVPLDSIQRLTLTGRGTTRTSWDRRPASVAATRENAERFLKQIDPEYKLAYFQDHADQQQVQLQAESRHYGVSPVLTWKNFLRNPDQPRDPFLHLRKRIELESLANQTYEVGSHVCGVYRVHDERSWVQFRLTGNEGGTRQRRAQDVRLDAKKASGLGRRIPFYGRERAVNRWCVGLVVCKGPVEGKRELMPYIKIGCTGKTPNKKTEQAFVERYNREGRQVLWVDAWAMFETETDAIAFETAVLDKTQIHQFGEKALPEGWTECRDVRALREVQTAFRRLCECTTSVGRNFVFKTD